MRSVEHGEGGEGEKVGHGEVGSPEGEKMEHRVEAVSPEERWLGMERKLTALREEGWEWGGGCQP